MHRFWWILFRRFMFRLTRRNVRTHWTSYVDKVSRVSDDVTIGPGVIVYGSCIGRFSYLGGGRFQDVDMGRFVSIGPRVFIGGFYSHDTTLLTTSPVFCDKRSPVGNPLGVYKSEPAFVKRVTIGNDVWIGADVRILDGVRIGNGSVIAAGAVVVKDVADYSIVGGVPARLIRMRYCKDLAAVLNESRWWHLSDDKLRELARRGLFSSQLSLESVSLLKEVLNDSDGE